MERKVISPTTQTGHTRVAGGGGGDRPDDLLFDLQRHLSDRYVNDVHFPSTPKEQKQKTTTTKSTMESKTCTSGVFLADATRHSIFFHVIIKLTM